MLCGGGGGQIVARGLVHDLAIDSVALGFAFNLLDLVDSRWRPRLLRSSVR